MSELTDDQLFVMTTSVKCDDCGTFCDNTPIKVDGKLLCKGCAGKAIEAGGKWEKR
jgi:formylmethanofuran dehydrogenase subunit E